MYATIDTYANSLGRRHNSLKPAPTEAAPDIIIIKKTPPDTPPPPPSQSSPCPLPPISPTGAVLRAVVVALSVELGGVHAPPEGLQQTLIRDQLRVVGNLRQILKRQPPFGLLASRIAGSTRSQRHCYSASCGDGPSTLPCPASVACRTTPSNRCCPPPVIAPHLYGLGVSAVAGADLSVGGPLGVALRVPHARLRHARDTLERQLDAPADVKRESVAVSFYPFVSMYPSPSPL
jgi:hypothetical protein